MLHFKDQVFPTYTEVESSRVMLHFKDQVFPTYTEVELRLLYTEGPAGHNTLTHSRGFM